MFKKACASQTKKMLNCFAQHQPDLVFMVDGCSTAALIYFTSLVKLWYDTKWRCGLESAGLSFWNTTGFEPARSVSALCWGFFIASTREMTYGGQA
jgi:hypothetical protein